MSRVPSLRQAHEMARVLEDSKCTVLCCACKKPLWLIEITGKYGTRVASKRTPYPGVPEYHEYWKPDHKTALRLDCPLCGKPYFKAVPVEGKPPVAVFELAEFK